MAWHEPQAEFPETLRLQLVRMRHGIDVCHTFIARCAGGGARPQLVGRATTTVLVRRQQKGPKVHVSQRLRGVPHENE
eukprot:4597566-Amphidinium_carterae.1